MTLSLIRLFFKENGCSENEIDSVCNIIGSDIVELSHDSSICNENQLRNALSNLSALQNLFNNEKLFVFNDRDQCRDIREDIFSKAIYLLQSLSSQLAPFEDQYVIRHLVEYVTLLDLFRSKSKSLDIKTLKEFFSTPLLASEHSPIMQQQINHIVHFVQIDELFAVIDNANNLFKNSGRDKEFIEIIDKLRVLHDLLIEEAPLRQGILDILELIRLVVSILQCKSASTHRHLKSQIDNMVTKNENIEIMLPSIMTWRKSLRWCGVFDIKISYHDIFGDTHLKESVEWGLEASFLKKLSIYQCDSEVTLPVVPNSSSLSLQENIPSILSKESVNILSMIVDSITRSQRLTSSSSSKDFLQIRDTSTMDIASQILSSKMALDMDEVEIDKLLKMSTSLYKKFQSHFDILDPDLVQLWVLFSVILAFEERYYQSTFVSSTPIERFENLITTIPIFSKEFSSLILSRFNEDTWQKMLNSNLVLSPQQWQLAAKFMGMPLSEDIVDTVDHSILFSFHSFIQQNRVIVDEFSSRIEHLWRSNVLTKRLDYFFFHSLVDPMASRKLEKEELGNLLQTYLCACSDFPNRFLTRSLIRFSTEENLSFSERLMSMYFSFYDVVSSWNSDCISLANLQLSSSLVSINHSQSDWQYLGLCGSNDDIAILWTLLEEIRQVITSLHTLYGSLHILNIPSQESLDHLLFMLSKNRISGFLKYAQFYEHATSFLKEATSCLKKWQKFQDMDDKLFGFRTHFSQSLVSDSTTIFLPIEVSKLPIESIRQMNQWLQKEHPIVELKSSMTWNSFDLTTTIDGYQQATTALLNYYSVFHDKLSQGLDDICLKENDWKMSNSANSSGLTWIHWATQNQYRANGLHNRLIEFGHQLRHCEEFPMEAFHRVSQTLHDFILNSNPFAQEGFDLFHIYYLVALLDQSIENNIWAFSFPSFLQHVPSLNSFHSFLDVNSESYIPLVSHHWNVWQWSQKILKDVIPGLFKRIQNFSKQKISQWKSYLDEIEQFLHQYCYCGDKESCVEDWALWKVFPYSHLWQCYQSMKKCFHLAVDNEYACHQIVIMQYVNVNSLVRNQQRVEEVFVSRLEDVGRLNSIARLTRKSYKLLLQYKYWMMLEMDSLKRKEKHDQAALQVREAVFQFLMHKYTITAYQSKMDVVMDLTKRVMKANQTLEEAKSCTVPWDALSKQCFHYLIDTCMAILQENWSNFHPCPDGLKAESFPAVSSLYSLGKILREHAAAISRFDILMSTENRSNIFQSSNYFKYIDFAQVEPLISFLRAIGFQSQEIQQRISLGVILIDIRNAINRGMWFASYNDVVSSTSTHTASIYSGRCVEEILASISVSGKEMNAKTNEIASSHQEFNFNALLIPRSIRLEFQRLQRELESRRSEKRLLQIISRGNEYLDDLDFKKINTTELEKILEDAALLTPSTTTTMPSAASSSSLSLLDIGKKILQMRNAVKRMDWRLTRSVVNSLLRCASLGFTPELVYEVSTLQRVCESMIAKESQFKRIVSRGQILPNLKDSITLDISQVDVSELLQFLNSFGYSSEDAGEKMNQKQNVLSLGEIEWRMTYTAQKIKMIRIFAMLGEYDKLAQEVASIEYAKLTSDCNQEISTVKSFLTYWNAIQRLSVAISHPYVRGNANGLQLDSPSFEELNLVLKGNSLINFSMESERSLEYAQMVKQCQWLSQLRFSVKAGKWKVQEVSDFIVSNLRSLVSSITKRPKSLISKYCASWFVDREVIGLNISSLVNPNIPSKSTSNSSTGFNHSIDLRTKDQQQPQQQPQQQQQQEEMASPSSQLNRKLGIKVEFSDSRYGVEEGESSMLSSKSSVYEDIENVKIALFSDILVKSLDKYSVPALLSHSDRIFSSMQNEIRLIRNELFNRISINLLEGSLSQDRWKNDDLMIHGVYLQDQILHHMMKRAMGPSTTSSSSSSASSSSLPVHNRPSIRPSMTSGSHVRESNDIARYFAGLSRTGKPSLSLQDTLEVVECFGIKSEECLKLFRTGKLKYYLEEALGDLKWEAMGSVLDLYDYLIRTDRCFEITFRQEKIDVDYWKSFLSLRRFRMQVYQYFREVGQEMDKFSDALKNDIYLRKVASKFGSIQKNCQSFLDAQQARNISRKEKLSAALIELLTKITQISFVIGWERKDNGESLTPSGMSFNSQATSMSSTMSAMNGGRNKKGNSPIKGSGDGELELKIEGINDHESFELKNLLLACEEALDPTLSIDAEFHWIRSFVARLLSNNMSNDLVGMSLTDESSHSMENKENQSNIAHQDELSTKNRQELDKIDVDSTADLVSIHEDHTIVYVAEIEKYQLKMEIEDVELFIEEIFEAILTLRKSKAIFLGMEQIEEKITSLHFLPSSHPTMDVRLRYVSLPDFQRQILSLVKSLLQSFVESSDTLCQKFSDNGMNLLEACTKRLIHFYRTEVDHKIRLPQNSSASSFFSIEAVLKSSVVSSKEKTISDVRNMDGFSLYFVCY